MELKFIKPKENASIAKITVHKTGKLGFSRGAAELLKITENKFCKFGISEQNELFIVMCKENDGETFGIAKAGDYYYVTAKSLLNDLDIDYKTKDTIIFDVIDIKDDKIFKLIQRIIKK
ncbi:hypothetical protein [Elizabethkingia anophelis]|uniref:hypothetical protein n=1 Tax=Elizabethkingia anophelis TaxID=1117645 RepID=UPI00075138BC|nr:hypothetical protein [Elizabethkingia anophelis]AQW89707.1 hypothetical protein BBD28_03110 [Elizabethkingia anophelis]KUY16316.1 hypothetical protein ATB94_05695 [Elizabethkingia anophelis]MCT3744639.1 hypothetical protein [Elizabethkingia anophelis]MDC8026484.1 hypothetical protein [Elizabethkingia anophelis]MDV3491322.1 hypothetical protein [Elizabethkingia anophelis]